MVLKVAHPCRIVHGLRLQCFHIESEEKIRARIELHLGNPDSKIYRLFKLVLAETQTQPGDRRQG
jgi:hypothetical protein